MKGKERHLDHSEGAGAAGGGAGALLSTLSITKLISSCGLLFPFSEGEQDEVTLEPDLVLGEGEALSPAWNTRLSKSSLSFCTFLQRSHRRCIAASGTSMERSQGARVQGCVPVRRTHSSIVARSNHQPASQAGSRIISCVIGL